MTLKRRENSLMIYNLSAGWLSRQESNGADDIVAYTRLPQIDSGTTVSDQTLPIASHCVVATIPEQLVEIQ